MDGVFKFIAIFVATFIALYLVASFIASLHFILPSLQIVAPGYCIFFTLSGRQSLLADKTDDLFQFFTESFLPCICFIVMIFGIFGEEFFL